MTNDITEKVVGFNNSKRLKGLPEDVRNACEERRKARITALSQPTPRNKQRYKRLNKKVKREVKRWKKKVLNLEIEEMESAYAKNNSHELF